MRVRQSLNESEVERVKRKGEMSRVSGLAIRSMAKKRSKGVIGSKSGGGRRLKRTHEGFPFDQEEKRKKRKERREGWKKESPRVVQLRDKSRVRGKDTAWSRHSTTKVCGNVL